MNSLDGSLPRRHSLGVPYKWYDMIDDQFHALLRDDVAKGGKTFGGNVTDNAEARLKGANDRWEDSKHPTTQVRME